MLYQITTAILMPFTMSLIKSMSGLGNVPKKGAFIIATNHVSYLDPIIIPLIFAKYFKRKVHFLAKKEFFEGFTGKIFGAATGGIALDREKGGTIGLKIALEAIKHGSIIGIFPEGGRSNNRKLQKGKTGAVRLALAARVPIVPIGIKGTYDLWSRHQKLFRMKKIVKVNIGKPIYFDKHYKKTITKKLLRALTRNVMKKIGELCGQKYNH